VVSQQPFGSAFDLYAGKKLPVFRYTLTNCNHVTADILNYGGITQSVTMPDKNGKLADVLLGFKTLNDYVAKASPPPPAAGGPYFGEIVGRYANRIASATFKLDGHTYTLPVNNGANTLHGGFVGFGNPVWASKAVHVTGAAGVQLHAGQPDGDAGENVGCVINGQPCTGLPGTLNRRAHLPARQRRPAVDALPRHGRRQADRPQSHHHAYFNMAGEHLAPAYGQEVNDQRRQVHAHRLGPESRPARKYPSRARRSTSVPLPHDRGTDQTPTTRN